MLHDRAVLASGGFVGLTLLLSAGLAPAGAGTVVDQIYLGPANENLQLTNAIAIGQTFVDLLPGGLTGFDVFVCCRSRRLHAGFGD